MIECLARNQIRVELCLVSSMMTGVWAAGWLKSGEVIHISDKPWKGIGQEPGARGKSDGRLLRP